VKGGDGRQPPWIRLAEGRLGLILILEASFLAFFYLIYGTTSALGDLQRRAFCPQFDFETGIPFVPSAALIYLTIGPALALAPFFMRTRGEITALFLTLLAETTVAGVCFLLLPVEMAHPPRFASGPGAPFFRLADLLNMEHNDLPSLHVALAFTAAWVIGRERHRGVRILLAGWVGAVCVSTLLMHEHHLVDLAAGLVLGGTAFRVVFRRVSRRSFLDALRIEGICLHEFGRFIARHSRYVGVFASLYGYSMFRWSATRPLRAGYSLLQHVDDVLDGDRRVSCDPETYVRKVRQWIAGAAEADGSALSCLATCVAAALDRAGGEGEDPRSDLLRLIDVLVEDRRRMDRGSRMGASALASHHRSTFRGSLNLALILMGSSLRADDVPELVDALAWCSPVRDLEEDFRKGLINIPEEVIRAAGAAGADVRDLRSLMASAATREWMRGEYRRGASAVEAIARRMAEVPDRPARALLAAFRRALSAYVERFSRAHPDLARAAAAPSAAPQLDLHAGDSPGR
jgi:membrane-associated phospholipid phosphatase